MTRMPNGPVESKRVLRAEAETISMEQPRQGHADDSGSSDELAGAEQRLLGPTSAEDVEHARVVMQVRAVALLALVANVLFWGTDLLVVRYAYPESDPIRLLLLRLAPVPGGAFLILRMWRSPLPGPWSVAAADAFICSLAAAIGCVAAELGGIEGPYLPVPLLGMIARSAAHPQPWQKALLPNVLVSLSFFAAMVLWGHDTVVHEQVRSARGLALFAIHIGGMLLGAGVLTLAAHNAWLLGSATKPSRRLGAYRLLRALDSGGFGEVWQAEHVRSGKLVAVKILRGEKSLDPTHRRRFALEADATQRLRHRGIVRTHEISMTPDGLCYLVMDLIDGVNGAQFIAENGVLPAGRLLPFAMELAEALEHAHSLGVVHRDVKPENIMFERAPSSGTRVVLLDFGIAALQQEHPRLTRTGVAIGTPKYMAPEARAGAPAAPTTDIYALGALLYFLRTGAPPEGELEWPAAPRDRDEGLLQKVVDRCLQPRPQDRYHSATELLDALHGRTET